MTHLIDKSALVAEIERRIKERDFQMKSGCWVSSTYMYEDLLDFLDTLEVKEVREESVSKDLEEAAFDYAEACKYDGGEKLLCVEHFKAGAQWQKQQNTLEVKEVDLDNELDFVKDAYYYFTSDERGSMKKVAKHFFELGIQQSKNDNNNEEKK